MPISIQCECGRRLDLPEAQAGLFIQCDGCGRELPVAAPLDPGTGPDRTEKPSTPAAPR